jgi:hypothetical protein
MEKRRPIYELQGIPNLSCDSVAQVSSLAAEKRKGAPYIDSYFDDFERQCDEKTREHLALEIYVQASLAREWLKQKDRARRLAARSQQTRLMRTNAAWTSAIAAIIVALLAGVSIFLH